MYQYITILSNVDLNLQPSKHDLDNCGSPNIPLENSVKVFGQILDQNTSLAAPVALAHRLQRCTACKIKNGR